MSFPKLLPGTWISAALWRKAEEELPVCSIVREQDSLKSWVKLEDGCWAPAGSEGTSFRAHLTAPILVVRIGKPEYTL